MLQSHTILGSKSQRGLTQMTLDVLFRSVAHNIVHPTNATSVFPSLAAADVSEAQIIPAFVFLEALYGDAQSLGGNFSRAQTPGFVSSLIPAMNEISYNLHKSSTKHRSNPILQNNTPQLPGSFPESEDSLPDVEQKTHLPTKLKAGSLNALHSFTRITRSKAAKINGSPLKEASCLSIPATRLRAPRTSMMPQVPSVEDINLKADLAAEYAIIVSMYEVYNDRIYDLLAGSVATAKAGVGKRRTLLFKSTEKSPDRKVVAGLKKIVCCSLDEALMVLETGLIERKVAGTGSNAVSSRSHGFFCVEVKKRNRIQKGPWSGSALTVVDLAGETKRHCYLETPTNVKQVLRERGKPKLPVPLWRKPARSTRVSCIWDNACRCTSTIKKAASRTLSRFDSVSSRSYCFQTRSRPPPPARTNNSITHTAIPRKQS